MWNCRRYRACTCDLLLGGERFCPSNVSPVEVGAMCCDRSWMLSVICFLGALHGDPALHGVGCGLGTTVV